MSKRKAQIVGTTEDNGRLMDSAENTPPHDDGVLFDLDADAGKEAASPVDDVPLVGAEPASEDTPADGRIPPAIVLAKKTLTGDLTAFLLDRLKFDHSPVPWSERSEATQRDMIAQAQAAAERAVTIAVNIVAGGGRRVIRATLDQITVKDGVIKGVLSLAKSDPQRHSLIDATGMLVFLTVADPDEFTGERAPLPIKPDQAAMRLETAGVVHSEADSAVEQATR